MEQRSGDADREKSPVTLRVSCPRCGARLPDGRKRCLECGITYRAAIYERDYPDPYAFENRLLNGGVVGGLVLMALGAAWFFVVWQQGWIMPWALVIVGIGLAGVLWGLWHGNLAGENPTDSHRRPVRRRPVRGRNRGRRRR
jgi:hypothetical protein